MENDHWTKKYLGHINLDCLISSVVICMYIGFTGYYAWKVYEDLNPPAIPPS